MQDLILKRFANRFGGRFRTFFVKLFMSNHAFAVGHVAVVLKIRSVGRDEPRRVVGLDIGTVVLGVRRQRETRTRTKFKMEKNYVHDVN